MPPVRIVFFGTAELAAVSLASLADEPRFSLVGVVTQPDRPKGRELKPQPSPVKVLANQRRLPVAQPPRCRQPDFIEQIRSLGPDLLVVAAYGQILPPALLEVPRWGCLNVHASLLPRLRGAAPIQWSIALGDAETGVTIMRMDAGLDTGDILRQTGVPITPDDTAETLHTRLAILGARLLVATIPDWLAGRITPRPQSAAEATYARKITRGDGRLDWSLPATAVVNRLRAFTPWPGAFTFLPAQPKPVLLKIRRAEAVVTSSGRPGEVLGAGRSGLIVACGSGALRVLELQQEGGRPMGAPEFVAGHPISPSSILG
jgi:methionyl-tRNA formyltransferase